MKVRFHQVIYCLLLLLSLTAADADDPTTRESGDVTRHERDSPQSPYEVEESNCIWRKEQLDVPYEHAPGAVEPDLTQLTLQYKSKLLRSSFALWKAAAQLAAIRPEPGRGVVIYLHGFFLEPAWINYDNVTDILVNKYDCDTLILDASALFGWYYTHSNTFIRSIGGMLGTILDTIIKQSVEPQRVHIVGHSLGAHVAAFASRQLTNLTGVKVGRISGLDPLNSCFSDVAPEWGLTATDADFVDVIHTDSSMFGVHAPLGHADFYPNSGHIQCDRHTLCSHLRANEYFVESILNDYAFVGRTCDSFDEGQCSGELSNMGFICRNTIRGEYSLRTNDQYPYGLGWEGSKPKYLPSNLMPYTSMQKYWGRSR